MAAENFFKYLTGDEHVKNLSAKILSGTSDEWKKFIKNEEGLLGFLTEAVTGLVEYYDTAGTGRKVLPSKAEQILAALNYCKPENVKVIILGQDPVRAYCEKKPLTTGLAFSYPQGITEEDVKKMIKEYKKKNPNRHEEPGRSVLDVHKALREAGIEPGESCCHEHWAERGVLLLNACLTIDPDKKTVPKTEAPDEKEKVNPHFKYWRSFIYNLLLKLLQKIHKKRKDVAPVYVLCWGTHAMDVGSDLKKKLGSRKEWNHDHAGEWDDDHDAGLLNPPPLIFIGHHPTYPTGAENKFIEQATNQFKTIKRYTRYSALFNQEEEKEE